MRAPLRAVVVAIVAVTVALNAQETCPPPAQPALHWVGLSSACTEANLAPCAVGETIVFSVTPAGGGSYPACVTYEWNFGGGPAPSTEASPSRVYLLDGAFFVNVRVSGGGSDGFDGREIVVTTVVPIVERFVASATSIRRGQTVVFSWSTKYATSVQLEPIGVTLDPAVTSYPLAPAVTRTYRLTAFGAAGFVTSRPVTVVVTIARRRSVRH